MKYSVDKPDFFTRSASVVAEDILGKYLCRKLDNGQILKMQICDVEAYDGNDPENYGVKYGVTEKNSPLFLQGGCLCIYCGMFLVVCGKENESDNVLIRGAGNEMRYINNPCNLCDYVMGRGEIAAMDNISEINVNDLNGKPLKEKESLLFIEDADGVLVCNTTRVNIPNNEKKRFILV